PQGDRGGSLDLYELVAALRQRKLELPLIIRFPAILEDRLNRLQAAFAKAITRYGYQGVYRGVFPVKCNQQRHLVDAIVKYGQQFDFGLEAGSKPELLIALAKLGTDGDLLICNGYKDQSYMETAILAQRLGQHPIIVLEQLGEVDMVIATARKLGLKPHLGVRAKLMTKGEGRWGISTGDRAKFGLSVTEIVETVERLKAADMLDSLELLHFHIGSQISSINVIKDALREAGQIYVQLVRMGARMGFLDVGGGLAVDYDGSKTNFYASKNYNMQNYANDVVAAIKDACKEKGVSVPTLISESGRALASHQSVLIFDILGASEVPRSNPQPPEPDSHLVIRNLYETFSTIKEQNYQEAYHDANQFKGEAVSLFNFGYLSLPERAQAERLYWACCRKILEVAREQDYVPDDLHALETILASTYYANISVFRSAPDCWAIEQLFPILPIHRLDEEPTERVTLADLTCDSDGRLDRFIARTEDTKPVLEVHTLHPDEPYILGLFLGGAYQEIMGNMHNLFGDTNAVHIQLGPHGGYQVEHVVRGDKMSEVLSWVQYNPADLVENVRQKTEEAASKGTITLEQAQTLIENYETCLRGYTYLARE
ncbi:MAG: biosynthetic arginine decarboxylase, partial [Candidatus Eremiobacteraeota bacterium]|nr:biosynthetic arginine decarboxylase [Candidatus Eremiobacteraeota bacterium]